MTSVNKTRIITTLVIVVCITALAASGVLSSVVLFVLLGAIPGTDYALPPAAMLGLFACLVIVVGNEQILRVLSVYYERRRIQRLAARRARLPHRRYLHRAHS